MGKKINITLLVLILVFGGFLLYRQLMGSPEKQTSSVGQSQTVSLENNGPQQKIDEKTLKEDITNKRYIEQSYMALEYSKVNNKDLIKQIKAFVDGTSKAKAADIADLINIHEKTFTNRYMKVFVSGHTEELASLNKDMLAEFYQMKRGFDTLHSFGRIIDPNKEATVSQGQAADGQQATANPNAAGAQPQSATQSATANPNSTEKPTTTGGAATDLAGSTTGAAANAGNTGQKDWETTIVTGKHKKPAPNFDKSILSKGIGEMEKAGTMVDNALEKAGKLDMGIEKRWMKAQLSEERILQVLDKSNAVKPKIDIKKAQDVDYSEQSYIQDDISELQQN